MLKQINRSWVLHDTGELCTQLTLYSTEHLVTQNNINCTTFQALSFRLGFVVFASKGIQFDISTSTGLSKLSEIMESFFKIS